MNNSNIMDNLQQYIGSHRDAVSKAEDNVPSGDKERFEERWDMYRHRIKFQSTLKRRRKPFWKIIAFPVAASLILIIGVRLLIRPFISSEVSASMTYTLSVPDTLTPAEVNSVYGDYMHRKVEEIYEISGSLSVREQEMVLGTVDNILREPVPLIDLLPEELGNKHMTAIVKAYAERRTKALETYRSKLVSSNNIQTIK